MALIDKASLLMVPSTYEDGTLYNVLPSGNKAPDETGNHNGYDQTRADFTFSRGSNLAATRVNASGLIEKGRENLLTYSNDFSNGVWAKSNLSVASANGAWEVTDNTTSGSHYLYWGGTTPASSVLTLSIEAKAGAEDYLAMRLGGFTYAFFNVANGTLGTINSSFIDAKIEETSDGFYRCSATILTPSSGSASVFYPSNNSSIVSYTGTGAVAITIKNAQLEYGLTASSYLDSGATTATAGVLENTPRIDYSSGAGALLLEPQRTNLITQSEYFGAYAKVTSDATAVPVVTDNYATSPEGVNNAARVVLTKPGTDNDYAVIREAKTVTKTSGDKMAQSVYLKATDATQVGKIVDIYSYDGSYLTVTNHTLTSDWKRVEAIHTASTGTSNVEMVIGKARGWAGGTTLANMATDFLVYGHQFENSASHVSSYVPTYGSAATRGADSCENATASTNIFGASKGAFYIEGYVNTLDANGIIPFTAGTGTSALMYVWIRTNGTLYVEWYESGVLQAQLNTTSGAVNVGDSFKIAAAYQNNDFVAYLNGTQVETDTNGTAPNPTSLKLGQYTSGAYKGGALSRVYVFNERLSNTELAALTA